MIWNTTVLMPRELAAHKRCLVRHTTGHFSYWWSWVIGRHFLPLPSPSHLVQLWWQQDLKHKLLSSSQTTPSAQFKTPPVRRLQWGLKTMIPFGSVLLVHVQGTAGGSTSLFRTNHQFMAGESRPWTGQQPWSSWVTCFSDRRAWKFVFIVYLSS